MHSPVHVTCSCEPKSDLFVFESSQPQNGPRCTNGTCMHGYLVTCWFLWCPVSFVSLTYGIQRFFLGYSLPDVAIESKFTNENYQRFAQFPAIASGQPDNLATGS
jgi:hypothetical protein